MGEASLKANFVPTRLVRGRARSEPILTTTAGEQIIGANILQSLPPRLPDVVTKQYQGLSFQLHPTVDLTYGATCLQVLRLASSRHE